MGYLKELVKQKLQGLETRQAYRNAARVHARKAERLRALRRDGKLHEITSSLKLLRQMGCVRDCMKSYGMTTVITGVGVTLTYRPDGLLDYVRPRCRQKQEEDAQTHLFNDGMTA